jgi:hypothetical protein
MNKKVNQLKQLFKKVIDDYFEKKNVHYKA